MGSVYREVQETKWRERPIACRNCKKTLKWLSSDPWSYCPFCGVALQVVAKDVKK